MSDDDARGYRSTSTGMLEDARMLFSDFPYAAVGGLSVRRGSGSAAPAPRLLLIQRFRAYGIASGILTLDLIAW